VKGIAPRPAGPAASRKAPCGGEIDVFVEEYAA
jgi:hypothetical protein